MGTKYKTRIFEWESDRFPEKVYDVVNDGQIVRWNGAGTAITVDPEEFENHILETYPGFVQIPTFANFRRLFREYKFDWEIIDEFGTFKFSHPYFRYGCQELLGSILTRRKSFREVTKDKVDEITENSDHEVNEDGKRRSKRQYRKKMKFARMNRHTEHGSNLDKLEQNVVSTESENSNHSNATQISCSAEEVVTPTLATVRTEKEKLWTDDILKLFIKHEFTFEEFCVWAKRYQPNLLRFGQGDCSLDPGVGGYQGLDFSNNASSSQLRFNSPCKRCACCDFFQNRFTDDCATGKQSGVENETSDLSAIMKTEKPFVYLDTDEVVFFDIDECDMLGATTV